MKKNSVLIFIASSDFSEEEFLYSKHFLEKNNCSVFITSDSNGLCIGDKGLKVKADVSLYNIHPENFSAFILIGGKGIRKYFSNSILLSIISKFQKQNKILGAICAAPVLLAKSGILDGKKATCFPDYKNELQKSGVVLSNEDIVVTEKIVTASNKQFVNDFLVKIIFLLNRTENL